MAQGSQLMMVIIDTTVWIDFFAGRQLPHVAVLENLIKKERTLISLLALSETKYPIAETEIDIFTWNYEADSWWSLDKQRVEMKADAIIKIIDRKRFSEAFYSKDRAINRLDDIIPPAIRNVFTSYQKDDLFDQKKKNINWSKIKPKVKDEIISLFSPYTKMFGMEITNLKIIIK